MPAADWAARLLVALRTTFVDFAAVALPVTFGFVTEPPCADCIPSDYRSTHRGQW